MKDSYSLRLHILGAFLLFAAGGCNRRNTAPAREVGGKNAAPAKSDAGRSLAQATDVPLKSFKDSVILTSRKPSSVHGTKKAPDAITVHQTPEEKAPTKKEAPPEPTPVEKTATAKPHFTNMNGPSFTQGLADVEKFECENDLRTAYWNARAALTAKFSSIDYMKGVLAGLSDKIKKNKNGYRFFISMSNENVRGFSKEYGDEFGELATKIKDYATRLRAPADGQAANKLYAEAAAKLASVDAWIKVQAKNPSEAISDIYFTDANDDLHPQKGLARFDAATAAASPKVAREDLLALAEKYDAFDKELDALRHVYSKVSESSDHVSGMDEARRALAAQPTEPRGEFATLEGAQDYLHLTSGQLMQLGLLKDCPLGKHTAFNYTAGAHTLIRAMTHLPATDPWNIPKRVKSTPHESLNDLLDPTKFNCAADFQNHLLSWTSRALRNDVNLEAMSQEMDKFEHSLEGKPQSAERKEAITKIQRLKTFDSEIASTQKQMSANLRAYFQWPKVGANEAAFRGMLENLETSLQNIPMSATRFDRTVNAYFPSTTEGPLAKFLAKAPAFASQGPAYAAQADKNLTHRYATVRARLADFAKLVAQQEVQVDDELSHENDALATKGFPDILRRWVLSAYDAKGTRDWNAMVSPDIAPANFANITERIQLIRDQLKSDGYLRDCDNKLPLSVEAHEDLRGLRVSAIRAELEGIVRKAFAEDKSCRMVVTGTDGEKSEANIIETHSYAKIESVRANAYTFLNLACHDWNQPYPLTPENLPAWKKVHPYLRPAVSDSSEDQVYDALNQSNFRSLPEHGEPRLKQSADSFRKDGIENLVYGASLTYALSQRETHTNPLIFNNDHQGVANIDTGVCHQSGTSLGNVGGLFRTDDNSNTIFPYSMDLLQRYVVRVRELAKDETPTGVNRFRSFCGTEPFEDKYRAFEKERQADDKAHRFRSIQQLALIDLDTRIQFVNPRSKKTELMTCDQVIATGAVKGYTDANISQCFRALQLYCPAYGLAHGNLVVRAMRWNNGPLHDESSGLRPACRSMFSNILASVQERDSRLCELSEKF